ncbi:MAG: ABC transporter substrate-binding protein [Halobacteriales archaeon]
MQREFTDLFDADLDRRHFIAVAGAAATASIAGCSGDGGGSPTDGSNPTATDAEVLGVLHGWTGGDGAEAVDALTAAFEEQHGDIETDFQPIGGGGNQNLDTVVANRLTNNDPPSAFANWPGKNLKRYEGALGNVDDVWADNDFEDAHVEQAVDLHQQDGVFRAVPLGSHRLNNLFYNSAVLEEAGIDPSGLTSIDAFVDALDAVATETDAVPMAHGMNGTWTTTQLWAAVMLGGKGFEPYMRFTRGNGKEEAVRATFETTASLLENYISDDASTVDLTASNDMIRNGDAAFQHQGNWAAGVYSNTEGFVYDEDWGAKAFPGTENMYTLHFDSFLYPSNNPSPEASKMWLGFVGGKTGQVAFNQLKGSIPTRTDVDMSEFNPYLQDAAEDFAKAERRPPTLQHGLAVESEVMSNLNDVIADEFSGPFRVDAATTGFMNAF